LQQPAEELVRLGEYCCLMKKTPDCLALLKRNMVNSSIIDKIKIEGDYFR
jgi:hypothetical protein